MKMSSCLDFVDSEGGYYVDFFCLAPAFRVARVLRWGYKGANLADRLASPAGKATLTTTFEEHPDVHRNGVGRPAGQPAEQPGLAGRFPGRPGEGDGGRKADGRVRRVRQDRL